MSIRYGLGSGRFRVLTALWSQSQPPGCEQSKSAATNTLPVSAPSVAFSSATPQPATSYAQLCAESGKHKLSDVQIGRA